MCYNIKCGKPQNNDNHILLLHFSFQAALADGGISSLPHMAGFGNGRGSMPLLRGSTPCHATKSFECRKADLPMEEKSEARRAVSSPQHSRTEVP